MHPKLHIMQGYPYTFLKCISGAEYELIFMLSINYPENSFSITKESENR